MNNHDHLYEVSIDELELPDEAEKVLRRTGVTTVGDCLDVHKPRLMSWLRNGTFFHEEFTRFCHRKKLTKHGYWSYVMHGKS